MYKPLDAVLLRAPLLRETAIPRAARALLAHPLGKRAIEIASPSLAAAAEGVKRERAIARYGRRAAFRSTPHGLLAGVCLGELGKQTDIATGKPEAYVVPSWAGVERTARALLDEAEVREQTRLRVAPSAVRAAAGVVRWIGPGEPFGELRVAEVDDRLAAVLDAADRWAPWPAVRERVSPDDGESDGDAEADDFLLMLVDDGLLHSDLTPPLVGPPAHVYLARKIVALGCTSVIAEAEGVQAVLVHRPRRTPVLERAAVERAARLVPLLITLNDALAPPVAERFAQPALADALDAVTETFGAGAFDVTGLLAGDYGVDTGGELDGGASPSPAVVALIMSAIADALARRLPEVALDPAAFAGLPVPALPPTAELFLVPAAIPAPAPGPDRARGSRTRRTGRRAPGAGWLLGVHAPAGASFGRFAHALGAPMAGALAALNRAERRARPDAELVDVAFTPSSELADLVAHPFTRRRTLALSGWCQHDDLTPRDLELVADPGQPDALALRERTRRQPIIPAALARVRSATAPSGMYRLLAGWSLHRQHAAWALALGPLAGLAFVPRITLEGFVVSPASWRLPSDRGAGALRRWRRELRVPRHVQVGDADELFPIDLDAPHAAADLGDHERVIEIWPPLGASLDRDGRRVEAVVMLVAEPDDAQARADQGVRAAQPVPPPRLAPPVPGWRSFKLFAASEHHDDLLASAVGPAIAEARAAAAIEGWFFLPYVDGPGRRPHLRLRVHAIGDPLHFERRLRTRLITARTRGQLTTLDAGDYHPERGRFAAGELDAVHAIFESDSDLRLALDLGDGLPRIACFVRAADATARGLGMDLPARETLARERRRAAEASSPPDESDRREADAGFRTVARELRAALAGNPGPPFLDHGDRVAGAAGALSPAAVARLLPTLLHHSAVRFLGPDPDAERIGYTFWARTLEGLRKGAAVK